MEFETGRIWNQCRQTSSGAIQFNIGGSVGVCYAWEANVPGTELMFDHNSGKITGFWHRRSVDIIPQGEVWVEPSVDSVGQIYFTNIPEPTLPDITHFGDDAKIYFDEETLSAYIQTVSTARLEVDKSSIGYWALLEVPSRGNQYGQRQYNAEYKYTKPAGVEQNNEFLKHESEEFFVVNGVKFGDVYTIGQLKANGAHWGSPIK